MAMYALSILPLIQAVFMVGANLVRYVGDAPAGGGPSHKATLRAVASTSMYIEGLQGGIPFSTR